MHVSALVCICLPLRRELMGGKALLLLFASIDESECEIVHFSMSFDFGVQ